MEKGGVWMKNREQMLKRLDEINLRIDEIYNTLRMDEGVFDDILYPELTQLQSEMDGIIVRLRY